MSAVVIPLSAGSEARRKRAEGYGDEHYVGVVEACDAGQRALDMESRGDLHGARAQIEVAISHLQRAFEVRDDPRTDIQRFIRLISVGLEVQSCGRRIEDAIKSRGLAAAEVIRLPRRRRRRAKK